MYVYPAGSGFRGIPKLVKPGEELFNEEKLPSSDSSGVSSVIATSTANCSTVSSDLVIPPSRPFNTPLKEEKLDELTHKNFSKETMKKVKWVLKMYREWRNYRQVNGFEQIGCDLDNKDTISRDGLIFALTRFITEVKKVDGSDFPGKTLYEIVVCIQFHLETLGFGWKLINEEGFKDVKFTLDNVMKMRTNDGIGLTVKKAQPLTQMDEEYLWSTGFLGCHNPDVLLNTVVFCIGKGLALRAGKEHHKLRAPPFNSQIQFMHDEDGIFIRYQEDMGFKTNKGGLKHRRVEPKVVDLFPISNSERCPVRIILKYLSLLPSNRLCESFYLQPKRKFSSICYFQDRPVGENKLRDTIKELCKSANLPGFYTNHSLRSTACTRMYNCNIDEQLIMEVTGHRSLSVRSYKRTCKSQRKYASNCLFETPQN